VWRCEAVVRRGPADRRCVSGGVSDLAAARPPPPDCVQGRESNCLLSPAQRGRWAEERGPEGASLTGDVEEREGGGSSRRIPGIAERKRNHQMFLYAGPRSTYGVVRQEQRLSSHRSGCGVVIVVDSESPLPRRRLLGCSPHCGYMDWGHRRGVYGDIGEAVMHRSRGAGSYYVVRHTFYFLTLGASPASTDHAHFRRADLELCPLERGTTRRCSGVQPVRQWRTPDRRTRRVLR
jgi:hypothetical protein